MALPFLSRLNVCASRSILESLFCPFQLQAQQSQIGFGPSDFAAELRDTVS
jgi:hypothetical protein